MYVYECPKLKKALMLASVLRTWKLMQAFDTKAQNTNDRGLNSLIGSQFMCERNPLSWPTPAGPGSSSRRAKWIGSSKPAARTRKTKSDYAYQSYEKHALDTYWSTRMIWLIVQTIQWINFFNPKLDESDTLLITIYNGSFVSVAKKETMKIFFRC